SAEAHQLARERPARRPLGERAACRAQHGRHPFPRLLRGGPGRGRGGEHARPRRPRCRGTGDPLPPAQGPRRPRRLRRRAELAASVDGPRPALPHGRLAPRQGDRPQLRVEGPRGHPAADAPAEGARSRADAAARRAGRRRAARPARAPVRPRDRRDLARPIRRTRQGRARAHRPSALAAAPRGTSRPVRAVRRPARRLGRRRLVPRSSGGGEGIQALRPARSRVVTAAGALAVASGLVVYAPLHADRLEAVTAAISLLGTLMLALAIVARFPGLVVWALAVLAGGYVVALLLRSGTIDGEAPLYAAGLLVCAELSFWSLE